VPIVVAVVAAGTIVVFIAVVVARILIAPPVFPDLSRIGQRSHLHTVPIAPDACPYVRSLHEAANNYQSAYPWMPNALDASGKPLSWPETRTRLLLAAGALEYTIVASTTHLPGSVRQYLNTVRQSIDAGRRQLLIAHDGDDFKNRALVYQQQGQRAFGFAADLVGSRCGVSLSADSETMLYPFGLTTTTVTPRP